MLTLCPGYVERWALRVEHDGRWGEWAIETKQQLSARWWRHCQRLCIYKGNSIPHASFEGWCGKLPSLTFKHLALILNRTYFDPFYLSVTAIRKAKTTRRFFNCHHSYTVSLYRANAALSIAIGGRVVTCFLLALIKANWRSFILLCNTPRSDISILNFRVCHLLSVCILVSPCFGYTFLFCSSRWHLAAVAV